MQESNAENDSHRKLGRSRSSHTTRRAANTQRGMHACAEATAQRPAGFFSSCLRTTAPRDLALRDITPRPTSTHAAGISSPGVHQRYDVMTHALHCCHVHNSYQPETGHLIAGHSSIPTNSSITATWGSSNQPQVIEIGGHTVAPWREDSSGGCQLCVLAAHRTSCSVAVS